MNEDGTISDTLSHEILEMLVDPAVNLYAYRPGQGTRPARGYFYEERRGKRGGFTTVWGGGGVHKKRHRLKSRIKTRGLL